MYLKDVCNNRVVVERTVHGGECLGHILKY
jgi:hypothetical protein